MSKNYLDLNNPIPDSEKIVKVTRSSAKKNEELEELISENSEISETETESEEEYEEEESSMETSGDEDDCKMDVSNIFIIIYIHII